MNTVQKLGLLHSKKFLKYIVFLKNSRNFRYFGILRVCQVEQDFYSFFAKCFPPYLMIFQSGALQRNFGKKWRKALFNLPSTHFSANSRYAKIGFLVPLPRLNMRILFLRIKVPIYQPCNAVYRIALLFSATYNRQVLIRFWTFSLDCPCPGWQHRQLEVVEVWYLLHWTLMWPK